MTLPEPSEKAVYSVVEVACLCELSKSRFYDLVQRKVFPPPVQSESCKRPYYTHDLANKCLAIRRTGIGLSGQVVLFNRKPKKPASRKKLASSSASSAPVASPEIVESLKSLGLSISPDAVAAAITKLFPAGIEGIDQGDVIRKVFLHLQGKKK